MSISPISRGLLMLLTHYLSHLKIKFGNFTHINISLRSHVALLVVALPLHLVVATCKFKPYKMNGMVMETF